ncbi:hypothetical protein GOV04_02305 [Candidatus Woesearchaeota archaeon]|nr:hypothetical protein [Candidatus Woesearchaeota archaeon]
MNKKIILKLVTSSLLVLLLMIILSSFVTAAGGCADFNNNGEVDVERLFDTYPRCYNGWGDERNKWLNCGSEDTVAFCNTQCVGMGYDGARAMDCIQGSDSPWGCSLDPYISYLQCTCYDDRYSDLWYLERYYGRTGITYSSGYNRYDLNNDGSINVNDRTEVFNVQRTTYPSSEPEICDGLDNDCDRTVDETCDDDNDNYCDDLITYDGDAATCTRGQNDCNDQDRLIPSGESCMDFIDNDCDGLIDFQDLDCHVDLDNDGFNATIDCDDSNININPAVRELQGNGIDDNCNGDIDEDPNRLLDCSFTQNNILCQADELCVLKLSDTFNAQASTCQSNYPNSLCCKADGVTLNVTDLNPFIRLSSATNAHLQAGDYPNQAEHYPVPIGLSAGAENPVVCRTTRDACTPQEEHMLSINDETNAHGAIGDDYDVKVCCKFGTRTNLLYYGGGFLSCNQEDTLESIRDEFEANGLARGDVDNRNTCDAVGTHFCDGNQWSQEGVQDTIEDIYYPAMNRTETKTWRGSSGGEGCCPESFCWYGLGQNCQYSQQKDPLEAAYNNGSTTVRCISGEWEEAIERTTPDGSTGYCPRTTDCLINPNGDYEQNYILENGSQAQCLENGQSYENSYCNAGVWTDMSTLVAIELLETINDASTDFTLYCDTYDEVANQRNYQVAGAGVPDDYFATGQKVCTIVFDDGRVGLGFYAEDLSSAIVIATNQNTSINPIGFGYPFENVCFARLMTPGITGFRICTDYNDGGLLDINKVLYYDSATKIFMVANSDVGLADSTAVGTLLDLFTNPILYFYNKAEFALTGIDYPAEMPEDFDKFYINKKDTKRIVGHSTTGGQINVTYYGFNTGICELLANKEAITCDDTTTSSITTITDDGTSINNWPLLTTNLRIK